MIETIHFKGKDYPKLQSVGNAMQYALPFAEQIIGKGKLVADVGANRSEWSYPGSILVDLAFDDEYHAMNLPPLNFDAIVSSHFLEHYIGRFQEVIEYWLTRVKKGGVIFLYLPNCSDQLYWAWGNTKHIHYLCPHIMKEYCAYLSSMDLISRSFVTEGYDLNSSFYCVIEK